MANYTHGRRRRRVLVIQTPVVTATQNNPIQPPRQIVPRNFRRPVQPARVISLKTPQLHGALQGGRPPITVVRIPGQRRTAQPIVTRTRPLPNTPLPSSIWLPRPQVIPDYARQGRWRPILIHTQSGRLPSPAMPAAPIIGRWRPGPPAIRPRIYSTRPRGATITPLPRVVAVRLPIIPWRIRPVTQLRTHPQSTIRPNPRLIVPIQTGTIRARPALPWRNYQVSVHTTQLSRINPPRPLVVSIPRQPVRPTRAIQLRSASGLFGPQRTTLIQPLIVRVPRQPVRPVRITRLGGGVGHTIALPMRPYISARPPARRIWPQPVMPAARYPLASPALHGPMPRPMIFRRPVRIFNSYRPTLTASPFPGSGSALPPDLVAAVIAWLRQQAAIVAAFGDSATTPKFGSDLVPTKTAPPYLTFFEPDEDESYESADFTGLPSSLTDGVLGCDLVGTGKLQVRQLAEQIAATVNDAPLTFQDGVLVYLRRTTRKFPTFTETGPGTNVVIYKRYMEFDFKIERWKPSF